MSCSPKKHSEQPHMSEDVDQWSEALIVKPEVAAQVLWPKDRRIAPGSRQIYQNPNVYIQVYHIIQVRYYDGALICLNRSRKIVPVPL